MNIIQKITYKKEFRSLARFFRLSNTFRKLYFYLFRPVSGKIIIKIGDLSGRFYVRTPGELRILESMGGGGSGEKAVLELLISKLSAGDVVYDVGGHVGLYTIFLAKAVGPQGKVITFEPEKQNYQHLLENIKLNDLNNVFVFKKALGEKDGKTKLYLGEDGGNSSLLQIHPTNADFELVDVANGDELVKKEKLSMPKAVKIDVEGFEYSVIEGLSGALKNSACKIVCCEIHVSLLPPSIKYDDILNLLKSLGFNNLDINRRDEEIHVIAQKKL